MRQHSRTPILQVLERMCDARCAKRGVFGAGSVEQEAESPKPPLVKGGGRGGIPVFDEQITVNVLNDFNDIYDFKDS